MVDFEIPAEAKAIREKVSLGEMPPWHSSASPATVTLSAADVQGE